VQTTGVRAAAAELEKQRTLSGHSWSTSGAWSEHSVNEQTQHGDRSHNTAEAYRCRHFGILPASVPIMVACPFDWRLTRLVDTSIGHFVTGSAGEEADIRGWECSQRDTHYFTSRFRFEIHSMRGECHDWKCPTLFPTMWLFFLKLSASLLLSCAPLSPNTRAYGSSRPTFRSRVACIRAPLRSLLYW